MSSKKTQPQVEFGQVQESTTTTPIIDPVSGLEVIEPTATFNDHLKRIGHKPCGCGEPK